MPARSQRMTLPSTAAVYRVRLSRLIASPVICAVWPTNVSPAAARRTFQAMTRLSSPAVTAMRPSALKEARITAPSWRPEPVRLVPVTRSTKRTEPSRPPTSIVRPSGLRAAPAGRKGMRLTGRSVRASKIVMPSPGLVIIRRLPSPLIMRSTGGRRAMERTGPTARPVRASNRVTLASWRSAE